MTITGLILAGGQGSRMGGLDKGLQPLHGTPMVAHVLHRLGPQVAALAINANQNLDAYRAFGLPVWPDATPEFAGPLAGLRTGLMHCTTDYLATVPCDSPSFPMDLIARLHHALEESAADAAFAITGEAALRQPHPVFCLLKTSLLPDLAQYLEGGGRRMTAWLASLSAVEVGFADEAAFRNINTLEELREFEVNG